MVTSNQQFGPRSQQMQLPGMGGGTEQMRLFDTHRAGPANVYRQNTATDASQWRDQDKQVGLNEVERQTLESDDEMPGQFFEFHSPAGSSERQHIAFGGAYGRSINEAMEAGDYLGADAFPSKPRQDLKFSDLRVEAADYDQRTWVTDEGTEVGKVSFHEDEWGPNVDYAEINPMYQGRGFSREAITDFAQDTTDDFGGIVHAGSYTGAGAGAFHAKGIPTVGDIENALESYVDSSDPDDDEVDAVTRAKLEEYRPDDPWLDDPSTWTPEMSDVYDEESGIARSDLREEARFDPDVRTGFREVLEGQQNQVLANLPGRKRAFNQGWRTKVPTFGQQEKLL